MNVLSLKELSAQVPAHAALLDLFQQCREHVVAVAATHLLPDTVAVTTRGGFVELIDTQTGAFRLFLTHLNHTPLDAALRCFSLVPGLVAASSRDLRNAPPQYLAYSLAYSNELLIAHMESGQVSVLASFTTRPSVVYCDGDYIACGEGCGQVSVWRISTESREPQLLWRLALFDDAVVALRVHREVLVCCAADGGCVVCAVDTGALVSRLVQEADQAVCVLPLTKPLVHHTVMAVCLPRRFSIYQSADDAYAHTRPQRGPEEPMAPWRYHGGLELDVEVQCASSFGGYLAAGTASGVVLLFACDAVRGSIEALVRFDVGFAVVAVQLYGADRLLVVTSAGDVWCWPLSDLLPSPEERLTDAEHPPEADACVPRPASPPPPAPATHDTTTPSGASGGEDAQDGEHRDSASSGDPRTLPALTAPVPRTGTSPSSAYRDALETKPTGLSKDDQHAKISGHRDDVRTPDWDNEATEPAPVATEGNRTIVMEVSLDDNDRDDEGDIIISAHGHSPAASSGSSTPYRGAAADRTQVMMTPDAPHHPTHREAAEGTREGTLIVRDAAQDDDENDSDDGPAALVALEKKLGSVGAVEGLRRGPRMDPRKLASVLHTAAIREQDEGAKDTTTTTGASRPSAPAALQSTQMLAAYRDALLNQHVADVDIDAYIAEHRLEAEALLYRYPVHQPSYQLEDRVFDAVTARAAPAITAPSGSPQSVLETLDTNALPRPLSAAQQKALAAVTDDLVDETYGRVPYKQDPALVAERQRGGPVLAAHFAEHLLAVPSTRAASTVLFDVPLDQPRQTWTLRLPLPQPATPSAF